MAYSITTLERVRTRLTALPTPDEQRKELNKQESVGFLAKDLVVSLRNGHTLDELAALLSEEGVNVTAVALKSHLRRVKPGRRKKRTGSRTPTPRAELATVVDADDIPTGVQRAPVVPVPAGRGSTLGDRTGPLVTLPPRPGSVPNGTSVPAKDGSKL